MRRHLGYYAHHHGSGHVLRARQVLARCTTPHHLLTSSADASGPGVVRLPMDVGGWSLDLPPPPLLHHAPVGHGGLRRRIAALSVWFADVDPALLVVDVSVEVTLLARLAGVVPVVVRQHGRRDDPAHRAAYDAAGALFAFWPAWAEDPNASQELHDRTIFLGGTSRLEGRQMPREEACVAAGLDPDDRHVVLLGGFGGNGPDVEQVAAAAAATPEHRWTVVGRPPRPSSVRARTTADVAGTIDVRGVVEDPTALLCAADVVVTHAGQNAVMDAAAVGARLVVVPEPRPFDEQQHFAVVLAAAGCAVVRPTWPCPSDWPAVLAATDEVDRDRLASLVSAGAARAAGHLDDLVDRLLGGEVARAAG
jgi:UDP-N-acetylglucosamine:LPS N-acetylglucosamine transferase